MPASGCASAIVMLPLRGGLCHALRCVKRSHMEFAERRRLVFYVILLFLVSGGMVYLSKVRVADTNESSSAITSNGPSIIVQSSAKAYEPTAYD